MKEKPKILSGATFDGLRTIGTVSSGQEVIVFTCGKKAKPFLTRIVRGVNTPKQPANPMVIVDRADHYGNLRLGGGTAVMANDHQDYRLWLEKVRRRKTRKK